MKVCEGWPLKSQKHVRAAVCYLQSTHLRPVPVFCALGWLKPGHGTSRDIVRCCKSTRRQSQVSECSLSSQKRSKGPTHAVNALTRRRCIALGVTCSATGEVSGPRQAEPADSSRGSNAVKVGLIALGAVSVLLFSTGSVQGIKASASKSILGRSGFLAAFSLIFLSEIGDKTFFIAGLLATRVGKWRSLIGSTIALAIMTVISVSIGTAFNSLPDFLKSSLPIGQYLGAGLMLIFGVRTLLDALKAPKQSSEGGDDGELHEAEISVESAEREGKMTQQASLWKTLLQVGTLIFLAEWGDRSMLATIALGASHPAAGVAIGATLAHAVATGIAVVGGSYASSYISERTIGLIGGGLFLVFSLLTFLGYF